MKLVYRAARHQSTRRLPQVPLSAGRARKADRVTDLLGLGADHDELDVGDLNAPQIGLLGRTKRHSELGDRAPIELVPACELRAELPRRLEPTHSLRLGPQDRLDLPHR